MSSTILSTKILSARQKDMLLSAHFQVVQYDAIKIVPLSFGVHTGNFDTLLITSQNAFKTFIKSKTVKELPSTQAFCVGEQTKTLLESKGIQVIACAENAKKLGELIATEHVAKSFLFISGKQRLNQLPKMLDEKNIRYQEVHVYETLLTKKKFNRNFDGVLFFSPTAVESYFHQNSLANGIAFCIGSTTAKSAQKFTKNIIIANKPSIENVIVQVVKKFNPYD
jgi:uroporphyrinogen-III synthase